jgi:hypothetical protein
MLKMNVRTLTISLYPMAFLQKYLQKTLSGPLNHLNPKLVLRLTSRLKMNELEGPVIVNGSSRPHRLVTFFNSENKLRTQS